GPPGAVSSDEPAVEISVRPDSRALGRTLISGGSPAATGRGAASSSSRQAVPPPRPGSSPANVAPAATPAATHGVSPLPAPRPRLATDPGIGATESSLSAEVHKATTTAATGASATGATPPSASATGASAT